MIVSEPQTLSGFVALGGEWGFKLVRYPCLGDGWVRRSLRIGPLYLSWSIAE